MDKEEIIDKEASLRLVIKHVTAYSALQTRTQQCSQMLDGKSCCLQIKCNTVYSDVTLINSLVNTMWETHIGEQKDVICPNNIQFVLKKRQVSD